MSETARQKAEEFLAVADQFRLGGLPTEQRHPLTQDLAHLARTDVPAALSILKDIDVGMIGDVITRLPELAALQKAMRDTLDSGGRVFFYGCGATGRLSLSIEYLWRFLHKNHPAAADKVLGFMSGGDLALIHSIENFEDHPAYGARQVRDVGFGENDLLVSCTEGGETPSVIGATEEAARISRRKPFFLYCNPDDILRAQVERSRRVLDDSGIEKICLYVGPMYLSGSTRLQASTALMLGAGLCLMRCAEGGDTLDPADLLSFVSKTDFSFLTPFVHAEADVYANGDYVLYETDVYGITILTDTTERAPTFSLLSFENQHASDRKPSLSYLRFPSAQDAAAGWREVLLRNPITIEWDELRAIAGMERIMGFDVSAQALQQRQQLTAPSVLHIFSITRSDDTMTFRFRDIVHTLDVSGLHPLFEHLFLKMALNMHSTLVMGRIGRFESNVMTWVKPSNKKLIDRAIRYVEHLLQYEDITQFSYADICHQLFIEAENMRPDQSVVLLTLAALKKKASND